MMSGDQTYAHSSEAKRGLLMIPEVLELFAKRVEARYGTKPLWIETDRVVTAGPNNVRRRIDLVFERTADFKGFLTDTFTFSTVRRETLAADFMETVSPSLWSSLFQLPHGKHWSEGLFICFSDFQPAACEAAHTAVPLADIDEMARQIGFGDCYWQSSRLWSAPTVFLYTDAQVRRFSSDQDFRTRLDDAYFDLAAAHDEFHVLERRRTFVSIDSKQNFDEKFDSNWHYYWK
jgi:hypothetical protein